MRRASRTSRTSDWRGAWELAVFLAGLSGIVWQWQRAERETERVRETAAREVAALLRNEAAKDALLEQARAFRASC
jgi:hypothetical protein